MSQPPSPSPQSCSSPPPAPPPATPPGRRSLGVARPARELLAVHRPAGAHRGRDRRLRRLGGAAQGAHQPRQPARPRRRARRTGSSRSRSTSTPLRHPTRGLFLVDTGIERALRDRPDEAAFRGLVASQMHLEALKVHVALGDWLAAHPGPVAGVFLTHLHPDHLTGLADVAAGTPVYAGPGEAERARVPEPLRAAQHRPGAARARALLPPGPSARGRRSLRGRRRRLRRRHRLGARGCRATPAAAPPTCVRTPRGPVLLTGDACHTRWGWEHDVEPGSFSSDVPRSAVSLARLRRAGGRAPRPSRSGSGTSPESSARPRRHPARPPAGLVPPGPSTIARPQVAGRSVTDR